MQIELTLVEETVYFYSFYTSTFVYIECICYYVLLFLSRCMLCYITANVENITVFKAIFAVLTKLTTFWFNRSSSQILDQLQIIGLVYSSFYH